MIFEGIFLLPLAASASFGDINIEWGILGALFRARFHIALVAIDLAFQVPILLLIVALVHGSLARRKE